MKILILSFLLVLPFSVGCNLAEKSADELVPEDNPTGRVWPSVDVRENGYMTEYTANMPKYYWNVTGCIQSSSQNDANVESSSGSGLRNHLLFQSLAGLADRALGNGSNDIALFAWASNLKTSNKLAHQWLQEQGVECLGNVPPQELALMDIDKKGSLRRLIDGYVLTDIANNSESSTVATVASHVYNAIIVDVKDKEIFDQAGFRMVYDASRKTTEDSWEEFKDKCNNKALVMMPVWMGELRSYAIAHNLFCINVLKERDESRGTNIDLLKKVNEWMEPYSPVYGASNWDEYKTDYVISQYGNTWIPYDWGYNTGITSLCYPERQLGLTQRTFNPQVIDFSTNDNYNFVNFYLSDGDNVQWVLGDFSPTWWKHEDAPSTKTAFGISIGQISQIDPGYLKQLLDEKGRNNTVFERQGYHFLDIFGDKKNRTEVLWQMAQETAIQMRTSNTRILATVSAGGTDTKKSIEGYEALVDANDQLEAIFTISYSPYADDTDDIIWISNRKGIDIPVIRTTYSIWNCGSSNHAYEGTPAYIAKKINQSKRQFCLICLHCWSKFNDTGTSMDPLSENIIGEDNLPWSSTVYGSGAAKACINRLGEKTKVVSLEELVWRIRMKYRPEQTKKVLGI